ncbi:hypothetical protein [Antarctobacter heliothermus]|uniref:Uncharacterized protein n=1 Tax=Antarctobacter heliothermus TaxID=74033 RepID=A0A239BDM8_9RHOB|nr:hypothetical protein [Antarctobacter heliothermus]SNS05976.1 hypothetical protein SAMN04488078_100347 [Antarctobacter heliothermus]
MLRPSPELCIDSAKRLILGEVSRAGLAGIWTWPRASAALDAGGREPDWEGDELARPTPSCLNGGYAMAKKSAGDHPELKLIVPAAAAIDIG